MEIIQQIGSYAGLAAIVGLAVLSALYFSQARDVRRMRESTGEAEPPPLPPGLTQAQRRTGKPSAAAAGTRPATSTGAALAGAARPAPGPNAAATVASPRQQAPVAEQSPTNSGAGPTRPTPQAAGRGGPPRGPVPTATAAPSGPAPSGRALGGAARPGPGAGRLAPPPSAGGARPWYRRLAARYVALIVAGVLVLGAAIAYGVTELTGEQAPPPAPAPAGGQADRSGGAPVDPSAVTVAVLNGTSVSGLAGQVADSVEAAGFQRGTVANATEQASAESAVLYAPNAQAAAREVGQELNISQIEPLNGQGSQAVSGDADVVVVVGNDQAE